MQIQIHSDNHIENSDKMVEWAKQAISSKLQRFDENLTRITVHVNDENGVKAGAHDKRCQIEARPKGLAPISVTHKSESVRLAVDGALDKLHAALTTQLGKQRSKRPAAAAPVGGEAARQDALLDEDFSEEQIDEQLDEQ